MATHRAADPNWTPDANGLVQYLQARSLAEKFDRNERGVY